MSVEALEREIAELGRVHDEVVVVGSTAAIEGLSHGQEEFPGFHREASDLDLAVSEGVMEHIREQPDWEEKTFKDGVTRYTNGHFDIGTGWHGTSFEDLRDRAWTSGHVQFAGLPDIFAAYHRTKPETEPKGQDITSIRDCLRDPERLPLSPEVLRHELAVVGACLPDQVHDRLDRISGGTDYLRLAANGLLIVSTLHGGHPRIGQFNQIVGSLEVAENRTPAAYHNAEGLPDDLRHLQQFLLDEGATDIEHLLALAIDPYTDAYYGNGRERDNRKHHDERMSGKLMYRHALWLGFEEAIAETMRDANIATTFNEETGAQRGTASLNRLERGVVAVDLQSLAEPEAVEDAFRVALEDGASLRHHPDRVIGQLICSLNTYVRTLEEGLLLVDTHGDQRFDGTVSVREFFARHLAGSAGFISGHEYPWDWSQDNPNMRKNDHPRILRRLSAAILAGEMGAGDAYQEAKRHTERMKDKYFS